MNANTIVGIFDGSLRNQAPVQNFATTVETPLVVTTDTGTATAFLVVPGQTGIVGSSTPLDSNANPAILGGGLGREYGQALGANRPYFNSASFNGVPFRVRISGVGTAGANAAQTVVINLYQGTSSTLASDKLIATTGAALATVAGGAFNFTVEATLLWDAASQILSGSQTADIAFGTVQQYTVPKAAANVVTGVTLANLSFLASAQFGNAAASTVQIQDFVIEQL